MEDVYCFLVSGLNGSNEFSVIMISKGVSILSSTATVLYGLSVLINAIIISLFVSLGLSLFAIGPCLVMFLYYVFLFYSSRGMLIFSFILMQFISIAVFLMGITFYFFSTAPDVAPDFSTIATTIFLLFYALFNPLLSVIISSLKSKNQ